MRSVLSSQSKRELVQQIVPRYQKACRSSKIVLLDECVVITGSVRTFAIQLLNHPEEQKPRSAQARLLHYGPEVQQALSPLMESDQSDLCQTADPVPAHPR